LRGEYYLVKCCSWSKKRSGRISGEAGRNGKKIMLLLSGLNQAESKGALAENKVKHHRLSKTGGIGGKGGLGEELRVLGLVNVIRISFCADTRRSGEDAYDSTGGLGGGES